MAGRTKFMFPPFEYKGGSALCLISNCQNLSLLMGACAFGGYDLVLEAYREAVKKISFLLYDLLVIL
jgi:S-adenosylmethionine:tRNA ribosyltransferase-isomerase